MSTKEEIKSVLHQDQNDHEEKKDSFLNLQNFQFSLNDIESRRTWNYHNTNNNNNDSEMYRSERMISSLSNTSTHSNDSNQVELVWKSSMNNNNNSKKRATLPPRQNTHSTSRLQEEVKSLLLRYPTISFLLFIMMLPLYCIAQLFLSLRDQILIILWRNIVIDNSSLKLKLNYRAEMIMKSKGFGISYHQQNLFYILYRISRRYYILFFNVFTFFFDYFIGTYYISLDKSAKGITASFFTIIQLIIYFLLAYINILSKRKTRGDIYDYLNQYHSLQYVNIIDSDHTEFKSLHEIKEDILQYGYVFLTTSNQGYFILSIYHLQDLDIHDLVSERLLRNDQEIIFINIKNPYHSTVIYKQRLYITVYKEPWSLYKIMKREINSDILIMDMKIYNIISLFFLMIYYLTSFDIARVFYIVFLILILLFFCIFIFRIRRYMNIQFRVVNEDDVSDDDEEHDEDEIEGEEVGEDSSGMKKAKIVRDNDTNKTKNLKENKKNQKKNKIRQRNTNKSHHSRKYHQFIDLLYLEKKGKQKLLNPWLIIQKKTFYSIFNYTKLEGRVSDVLLRFLQDLSYDYINNGLEINDFIKYIDHLSNINAIGIKILYKNIYLLYSNIEEENLNKVIIYDEENNGILKLEDIEKIDFSVIQLASKELFESLKGQRVQ